MDKDIDFEQWWDKWTRCPRCKMSDATRLAASNAWYNRQHELVEAYRQLTKLKSERDAAVEALRFYACWTNWSQIPGKPDVYPLMPFDSEEVPMHGKDKPDIISGKLARAVLAMIDKEEKK